MRLHCYEPPEDLPPSVEVVDASQLMPESEFFGGRLALGSDRYRYRLVEAGYGLYVDCDVFCVAPIPDRDYIYGWENPYSINCAVLKFPPGCTLSQDLLAATANEYYVPFWYSRSKRMWLNARKSAGFGKSVLHMEWGVWGPELVTRLIRKNDLTDEAAPIDVYHPVQGVSTPLLFEPELRIDDLITPRTLTIHLCNSFLKGRDVPAGSPLDELIQRGLGAQAA